MLKNTASITFDWRIVVRMRRVYHVIKYVAESTFPTSGSVILFHQSPLIIVRASLIADPNPNKRPATAHGGQSQLAPQPANPRIVF